MPALATFGAQDRKALIVPQLVCGWLFHYLSLAVHSDRLGRFTASIRAGAPEYL